MTTAVPVEPPPRPSAVMYDVLIPLTPHPHHHHHHHYPTLHWTTVFLRRVIIPSSTEKTIIRNKYICIRRIYLLINSVCYVQKRNNTYFVLYRAKPCTYYGSRNVFCNIIIIFCSCMHFSFVCFSFSSYRFYVPSALRFRYTERVFQSPVHIYSALANPLTTPETRETPNIHR